MLRLMSEWKTCSRLFFHKCLSLVQCSELLRNDENPNLGTRITSQVWVFQHGEIMSWNKKEPGHLYSISESFFPFITESINKSVMVFFFKKRSLSRPHSWILFTLKSFCKQLLSWVYLAWRTLFQKCKQNLIYITFNLFFPFLLT